ncbi:MAG: hypothetical protein KatS3mg110_0676 [Pirellulaceae bacterium]|nr:MAG: hypothetical protein KatS3mg110_0676 [Pirellulaceae bacterium]
MGAGVDDRSRRGMPTRYGDGTLSARSAGLVVLGTISLLFPAGTGYAEGPILEGEEARQYALVVYDGYVSNREKFRYYICTCRLQVSTKVRGLEEAFRGNLPLDDEYCPHFGRSQADLVCARSGDILLYRFRTPQTPRPIDIKELPKPQMTPQATPVKLGFCFLDYDVLFDSTYVINTCFTNYIAEKARWNAWNVSNYGPWNRRIQGGEDEMDELGRWLEAMAQRRDLNMTVRVERNVDRWDFPTTLIKVVVVTPNYPNLKGGEPLISTTFFKYSIDESRGYIPIHIEGVQYLSPAKQPAKRELLAVWGTHCLDIRKVGRGWWPYHWVSAQVRADGLTVETVWKGVDASSGQPVKLLIDAMEGEVIDLQLRKPPRKLLAVTFSKGDGVRAPYGEGYSPIRFTEPTEVTVDDIPRLLAMYFRQPPPPPKRGWQSAVLVIAALLFSTALLGWLVYRRYRRR